MADPATSTPLAPSPTNGKAAPSKAGLEDVVAGRKIPDPVIARIKEMPRNVHPMAALRTLLSEAGLYDSQAEDMSREANIEKGIRMIGMMPQLVAYSDASRNGKPFLEPKNNL